MKLFFNLPRHSIWGKGKERLLLPKLRKPNRPGFRWGRSVYSIYPFWPSTFRYSFTYPPRKREPRNQRRPIHLPKGLGSAHSESGTPGIPPLTAGLPSTNIIGANFGFIIGK